MQRKKFDNFWEEKKRKLMKKKKLSDIRGRIGVAIAILNQNL
jgi:hypothetical protein